MKRYAYYTKKDKMVSIYEALQMKEDELLGQSREESVLFDFRNPQYRSPVLPMNGRKKKYGWGEPYFRYYAVRDKTTILYPKEMSNAHLMYQKMFEHLKKFKIKDGNSPPITVYIENADIEFYVRTEKKKGILIDVLLTVSRTVPSSYKYLWNSKLAIEVYVTHRVDPLKKKIIEKNNIATYEAEVFDSLREAIPDTQDLWTNEAIYNKQMRRLVYLYEKNSEWILFGDFITRSLPNPENEETYKMLKQAEIELAKYRKEIRRLEEIKADLISEDKALRQRVIDLRSQCNTLEEKSGGLEKLMEDKVNLKNQLAHEKEKRTTKIEYEAKNIVVRRKSPLDKIRNFFKG